MIQVLEGDSQLSIDNIGARISLTLKDIPVLSKIQRGDGKEGSTHPCTPIFGPDRSNLYGLTQHGLMRNQECQVDQASSNQIIVEHDITDQGYPLGLKVTQLMSLEEGKFVFEMIHKNTGSQNVALNSGEHCYFDAPLGYSGTKINDIEVSKFVEDNKDGYVFNFESESIIQIPGKPSYRLEQNGFSKLMLWVGRDPQTGLNDNNYICIEPVEYDPQSNFFGTAESMLSVGSERRSVFSIEIA